MATVREIIECLDKLSSDEEIIATWWRQADFQFAEQKKGYTFI